VVLPRVSNTFAFWRFKGNPMSFEALPPDIVRKIMAHAGFRAAVSLAFTSKYMSELFFDAKEADALWRKLYCSWWTPTGNAEYGEWMARFRDRMLSTCAICGAELRPAESNKTHIACCFDCCAAKDAGERIYDV